MGGYGLAAVLIVAGLVYLVVSEVIRRRNAHNRLVDERRERREVLRELERHRSDDENSAR